MLAQSTFQNLDTVKPWDSQKQKLECSMILQDAHDVKTFCFQTSDQSWFRYLPGQFITLELNMGGKQVHGTYTLSSSPSRPMSISVTVKAAANGNVSKWLHENMKVGDTVKAYGPAGLFSFHNHMAEKYLFLSGGVGVTPLMSMTRWLFDSGKYTDISFIQCCRTPSDLLFKNELESMSARVPQLNLSYVCEEADEYGSWTGYRGRINQLMLELISSDYMEREIFCCGPEPFMQAVRDILIAAGYDMDRYHEESFTAPVASEEEALERDDVVIDDAATATVNFAKSNKQISCKESDSVLDAAKEAGLHIPNACQFGVCGTCKVKKTSGDVHMVHNGGINDADVADGYILACCSNPLGAVEIEF